MKTAFIDRDGTIIQNTAFINTPEQMIDRCFVRGAVKGMMNLQHHGWQLVVVTNQGGVGKGFLTEPTLREINAVLIGRLAERGIKLKNFRYCPHAPEDGCDCRKPSPGMLFRSVVEDYATLHESIMIGDDDRDMECGKLAGVRACYQVTKEEGWNAFDLSE